MASRRGCKYTEEDICLIEGCERQAKRKGMCIRHYNQDYRRRKSRYIAQLEARVAEVEREREARE